MKTRWLKFLVSLMIAAYLAAAPFLLKGRLGRDEYREMLTKPPVEWRGRIELWHIAGFRVYQGSVTDYLAARAKAYCKKHPGVHIEVTGLTLEKYYDRVARGAFPDAYSFPLGLCYAEQFRPVEISLPTFAGGLRAAVSERGNVLAVPWLFSGYFLAANEQRLSALGLALPETPDAAFLQGILGLGDTPQLSIPAVHAARMNLSGQTAPAAEFTSGKAALAVLDARAVGDLARGTSGNLLLDAVPLAPYTELVQYVGAARGADEEQAEALAGFIAYLLTEPEQQRLSTLGALPVVQNVPDVVYADDLPAALHRALLKPAVPDPFLYQRHKDALLIEAEAALAGDESAKRAFFERLSVVEQGNL